MEARQFHGLVHLKTLILNNMPRLDKIEPVAFSSLKHLEVLECRNNRYLNKIDPFAFYDHLEDKE